MGNNIHIQRYIYRTLFRLYVFCLLGCISLNLKGQTSSFQSITISDGLSHNTINVIYKDCRGFVWLGTQIGLDRFDGVEIMNYPQFDGHTVYSIAETDSINLWIGTDKGLIKFNRKTEVSEPVHLANKPLVVKHVFVDKQGRLFISSSSGLYIGEKGTFQRILFNSNVLSLTNNVFGVINGEGDTIWAITNDGLVHYDIKNHHVEVYKNDFKGGINGYSCFTMIGHTIYLGTASRGMLTFDVKKKAFALYAEIGNGCINALVSVGRDSLYVGTNGSGIKIVQASTGKEVSSIEHTVDGKGICSNAVYSLYKDRNTLWVGTYMSGLSYTPTRGNVFSVYSYASLFDSHNMNVRAFYIGSNGRKVIGTRDGLYYISEKEHMVRSYTSESSILRSNIICLCKPLNENFLIGTYGGGLYLLNSKNGELSFFKPDSCFMENSFTECKEDKDGNFWISATNGVYMYNIHTDRYTFYDARNSSIPCKSVFTVEVDSKNRVWFGGAGAVFLYDKNTETFKTDIFPEDILPYTKSIRYIYEDSHKNLWFCDDKEGVVQVDEHFTKFKHITKNDFLLDNSVSSMVEDPEGKGLWFATQRGLMRMESGNYRVYSLYDGISGYIFNNSVQVTEDGTIWWGNECGLIHYVPRTETIQPIEPPVITSIAIAGKELRAGEELMPVSSVFMEKIGLPAHNNITFSFSALNYAVEATTMYEYCLSGYDDRWNFLSTDNRVSYVNLPTGHYTFKVRTTSNPDAVRTMEVEVVRNFSYLGSFLLLGGIACAVIIARFYRLLDKYKKKVLSIQTMKENESEVLEEKQKKSKIGQDEASHIEEKLRDCMERGKMYLKPNLKLQDVAVAIGCNAVDLSQVLNSYKHVNFADYVNQYRVEEFIVRIQDSSAAKFTLSSLSEQCGFSSRTSFFRSFKKLKGKSPAEYIKEAGILLQ